MSNGYIRSGLTVLSEQYDFISFITHGLSEKEIRLFNHILTCSLSPAYKDGFVPVPYAVMRKYLRGVNWRNLEHNGLIEATGYSTVKNLCREFRPANWVKTEFLAILANYSPIEYLSAEKVNLFTGRQVRSRERSRLYDENRHQEPSLIKSAIQTLERNGCLFNIQSVQNHLKGLLEGRDRAREVYGPDSHQFVTANSRYLNDYYCFYKGVLDQNPEQIDGNIWCYIPAYFVASTGRIFQKSGGLQSSSRAMKLAAYGNLDVLKNLDLKSSQVNVLIEELEQSGFNTDWLIEYLTTPNAKQVYADRVSMRVETWKRCLLALIMGADLPNSIGVLQVRKSDIAEYLLAEANTDYIEAEILLQRLIAVVNPLVEEVAKWHNWLLENYIPSNKRPCPNDGYIINATGKRLLLGNLPGTKRQAKAKVAAFLLQGRESAFIHHLTILGEQYDYKAIANEHDGLIVIGPVPDEAIERARTLSCFLRAELEEKPFSEQSSQQSLEQDTVSMLAGGLAIAASELSH